MQFKNYKKQPVDLLQHCLAQKALHQDLKVHVGTDSISVSGKISYFAVVAFRYGSNGVHFIYHKEIIETTSKNRGKWGVFMKLRHEAELSIAIADKLIETGMFSTEDIILELDFNNVVDTLYQGLIPEIKGMGIWKGYNMKVKFKDQTKFGKVVTEDLIAVKAADHLCQGVSGK